jgi:hypothetical protein
MPLMSITAPQKHVDRPLASWVGSLHPESHIAYFQGSGGGLARTCRIEAPPHRLGKAMISGDGPDRRNP